jgi:hypothetical protein
VWIVESGHGVDDSLNHVAFVVSRHLDGDRGQLGAVDRRARRFLYAMIEEEKG